MPGWKNEKLYKNKFKYAIVGIGQIKNFENRYKIFKNLKKLNFKYKNSNKKILNEK